MTDSWTGPGNEASLYWKLHHHELLVTLILTQYLQVRAEILPADR